MAELKVFHSQVKTPFYDSLFIQAGEAWYSEIYTLQTQQGQPCVLGEGMCSLLEANTLYIFPQLRASLLSLAHLSAVCVSLSLSFLPISLAPLSCPPLSWPFIPVHTAMSSKVQTPAACRNWEWMNGDGFSCCRVLWNICCIGKGSQIPRSWLKLTIAETFLWEVEGCRIWEKLSVLAGTSLGTFPMGVTLC